MERNSVGAAMGGRGGGGGFGGDGPFGAATGQREEERKHRVKYGLPSAAHFEPDDPDLDPHREGWYVAPEVLGEDG